MIELEPGDVALLDAQRTERLEAIRLKAERRARCKDLLPKRERIVASDIYLIRKLARETQSDHAQLNAFGAGLQTAHVRQSRIRQIDLGQRELKYRTRLWACDRHARPFIGD